jgi:hypothetical protein
VPGSGRQILASQEYTSYFFAQQIASVSYVSPSAVTGYTLTPLFGPGAGASAILPGDWVYLFHTDLSIVPAPSVAGFTQVFANVEGEGGANDIQVSVWRRKWQVGDTDIVTTTPSRFQRATAIWVRNASDDLPVFGPVSAVRGALSPAINVAPAIFVPKRSLAWAVSTERTTALIGDPIITSSASPEGTFANPLTDFATPGTSSTHTTIAQWLPLVNDAMLPSVSFNYQTADTGAGRAFQMYIRPSLIPNIDTYARISSNPSGTGAGVPGRTITETQPDAAGLLPSTTYVITGSAKFTTPGIWLWEDVKNQGTWLNLRTTKASWDAVRTTSTGLGVSGIYNSLYVSLSDGVTDYVAPVKVIDTPIENVNTWFDFVIFVTTPGSLSPTTKLRLLHGTQTREYSTVWQIKRFQMELASRWNAGRLFYMDGDTPDPTDPLPPALTLAGFKDFSADASLGWDGTPGNSVSTFLMPSTIEATTTCQLDTPNIENCGPVLLSDPITLSVAVWFTLVEISPVDRAARMSTFYPLNRPDPIAVSQSRNWETGKLTLMTRTLEQRLQAEILFSSGRVLYLRNTDPLYPENMWYLACATVTESRAFPTDHRRPERLWEVPYVRVARPDGLIQASSGVTWQQIKDAYTWSTLRSTKANWLSVLVGTVP